MLYYLSVKERSLCTVQTFSILIFQMKFPALLPDWSLNCPAYNDLELFRSRNLLSYLRTLHYIQTNVIRLK